MPDPTPDRFSPDGRWWWDGGQWLPAVSADGRHRWDGEAWQPTRGTRSGTWIALSCVIGVLTLFGGCTGLLYVTGGFRSHVSVSVMNDTTAPVTLSGCLGDPGSVGVSAGGSVTVDPFAQDPGSACAVWSGPAGAYQGCILMPTGSTDPSHVYLVSEKVNRPLANGCGDLGRFNG